MDLKSSKKDVELPLLTKSNQKQTHNEQSYTFSSLKENQPQSLKYFNINIFSRIVFGWVNAFIYV